MRFCLSIALRPEWYYQRYGRRYKNLLPKREGFIGLDHVAAPDVDHVMDVMKERLPFEDGMVDHVFSAHFLEHINIPFPLLTEIARVCTDGARIEFWTPYGFTNDVSLRVSKFLRKRFGYTSAIHSAIPGKECCVVDGSS